MSFPPGMTLAELPLRRFPLIRIGGAEDGIEDSHIPEAVFERDRDFGVFQNCLGKGVALHRVLIGGGEGLRGDAAAVEVSAVVDEEACGMIQRRVERDLDLDAPARAQEVYALVGD